MRNVCFEISNGTVTLINRTVNCNGLSKEEFVNMIMEDLNVAESQYQTVAVPQITETKIARLNDSYSDRILQVEKNANEYANKKWKTAKRRMQYVDEQLNAFKAEHERLLTFIKNQKYSLDFFDFDPSCGTSMSLNNYCVLRINASSEYIGKCYDVMKESNYFNNAIGWKFTYNKSSDSLLSAFRPQITLILPNNIQDEVDNAVNRLTENMSNYYNSSKYTGD